MSEQPPKETMGALIPFPKVPASWPPEMVLRVALMEAGDMDQLVVAYRKKGEPPALLLSNEASPPFLAHISIIMGHLAARGSFPQASPPPPKEQA